MADPTTCAPLTPTSIAHAATLIAPYIHRTPLLTNTTLSTLASHPSAQDPIPPKLNIFLKCESHQKTGSFKSRGAHHALLHLIQTLTLPVLQLRGVVTHSSGNHAQALALAASTFNVPAYIVMPSISTPSKIAGTRKYTDNVIFSGSTEPERVKMVNEVVAKTGAVLVHPYDHPDIILGQGTVGAEMEEQFSLLMPGGISDAEFPAWDTKRRLDAVIAPIGGGGLLAGIAAYFSRSGSDDGEKTIVFGAEPSFQDANDAQRGLAEGKRVEHVSSLTIADGLRTPVGVWNWGIVSDKGYVEGVYSVAEDEIKEAMRLLFERVKVVVEPSGAVALAAVLFDDGLRRRLREVQDERGLERLNMGVVVSGGNTTVEAVGTLFREVEKGGKGVSGERKAGMVGLNGQRKAEDVAG